MTEEALIQSLLKVLIVAETTERDMNLLDIILSRMNDLERVCTIYLFVINQQSIKWGTLSVIISNAGVNSLFLSLLSLSLILGRECRLGILLQLINTHLSIFG